MPRGHPKSTPNPKKAYVPFFPSKHCTAKMMYDNGDSFKVIGEHLGCDPTTVSHGLKKLGHSKNFHKHNPPPGCPHKISTPLHKKLVAAIDNDEDPDATSVCNCLALHVSVHTTQCWLAEQGLHGHHRASVPHLSELQAEKRFDIANEHGEWTVEVWQDIFSDEVCISLGGLDGMQWCRRRVGERYKRSKVCPKKVFGGGGLM